MFQSDEVTAFLVDRIKHPTADMAYGHSGEETTGQWAARTRAWAREQLHYSPAETDLDPVVVEEEDFGSYVRQTITYRSAPRCRVSAYLLLPKDSKRRAPAVLALHDHSGRYYYGKEKLADHRESLPFVEWFQQFRYGGRGYASVLAEQGYVVLCPDALGWGDRRFLDESWIGPHRQDLAQYVPGSDAYFFAYDQMISESLPRLMDAIAFAGATFPGILYWDDKRGLDLLCSLPQVDPKRVGCLGLSMGGYRAALLGALEERIKCCCIVGYLTMFQDLGPKRCPTGWGVPGLFNRLPYGDFVSLTAPRHLLSLNCENDGLFDLSTIQAAAGRVRRVYEAAGAAERFTQRGFPVGHQFGLEMQEAAFRWLEERL